MDTTLVTLPAELLHMIIGELFISEVVAYFSSSNGTYQLLDENVYQRLALRYFPCTSKNREDTWRDIVKYKYQGYYRLAWLSANVNDVKLFANGGRSFWVRNMVKNWHKAFVADSKGQLWAIHSVSGSPVATPDHGVKNVTSVAMAHNGLTVTSTGADHLVKVNGEVWRRLGNIPGALSICAGRADQELLFVLDKRGNFEIWKGENKLNGYGDILSISSVNKVIHLSGRRYMANHEYLLPCTDLVQGRKDYVENQVLRSKLVALSTTGELDLFSWVNEVWSFDHTISKPGELVANFEVVSDIVLVLLH